MDRIHQLLSSHFFKDTLSTTQFITAEKCFLLTGFYFEYEKKSYARL